METIEAIVKLLSRCPKSPLFKFEMNGEAAESNFHVLRKFNFDLEKALVAQVGLPVGTGRNSVKVNYHPPPLQEPSPLELNEGDAYPWIAMANQAHHRRG